MFKKIILVITVQLAVCLKSTDFCTLKQYACKGFYDKEQNYQINCKPINAKCHGTFSFECESNLCTKSKIKCDIYRMGLSILNSNLKKNI